MYWRMYRMSFRRRSGTEVRCHGGDDVPLDPGVPQFDPLAGSKAGLLLGAFRISGAAGLTLQDAAPW